MSDWLIYGSNGYTGKLIVDEALRQGMRPVLAGRNRDAVDAQAREHGLDARAFALDDPAAVARGIDGMRLVLNCAGPFSQTAQPVLDACLAARAHYLDLTGEIDVFALCHRAHDRAVAAGTIVAPGTGFDVVPTDCTAAMLKEKLPDATHLVLAFEAGGGPSPGTAKTSVEGLARGGRARIDGKVVEVPLGWKARTFDRDGEARTAMTIPWGDVYTAYVSTGIPNVETYMAVPPSTVARVRRLRWFKPLLGLGFVQSFMKKRIDASTPGPSAARRDKTDCRVWGEARNARGDAATLSLSAPNGYALTATASVGMVRAALEGGRPGGYYTPSMLMGSQYVLSLPGVRIV